MVLLCGSCLDLALLASWVRVYGPEIAHQLICALSPGNPETLLVHLALGLFLHVHDTQLGGDVLEFMSLLTPRLVVVVMANGCHAVLRVWDKA